MAWRVCSNPGCGTLHEGTGRCATCERAAERRRRPRGNPYSSRGHLAFREAVLAMNPRCVCRGCGGHDGLCAAVATVADHFPHERADLVAMGQDPDDPAHGRGVCAPCHDRKTARTRPAGWNAPTV